MIDIWIAVPLHPAAMATVAITVMTLDRQDWKPCGHANVCLVKPTPDEYLLWHHAISPNWWMAAKMTNVELKRHIASAKIYRSPEGYFEYIDKNRLAYFGIFPMHRNAGHGKRLLSTAIAVQPGGVWLTTNTTDSPHAIPLYLSAGFKIASTFDEQWPDA